MTGDVETVGLGIQVHIVTSDGGSEELELDFEGVDEVESFEVHGLDEDAVVVEDEAEGHVVDVVDELDLTEALLWEGLGGQGGLPGSDLALVGREGWSPHRL